MPISLLSILTVKKLSRPNLCCIDIVTARMWGGGCGARSSGQFCADKPCFSMVKSQDHLQENLFDPTTEMSSRSSPDPDETADIVAELSKANKAFMRRYPGESN